MQTPNTTKKEKHYYNNIKHTNQNPQSKTKQKIFPRFIYSGYYLKLQNNELLYPRLTDGIFK